MKFSVLMSIYKNDNPKFLREAIDSVINQTLIPNEIVIMIDGQVPREISEVLEGFSSRYNELFNIVQLPQNVGLGVALNEGVTKCKYDIIARMDSDDICREDRFEKQIAEFKKNKNLSMVGSYIAEFYDDLNEIKAIRKVPISFVEVKVFAKKRNPMNHMTVMYKKSSVIDSGNYKHFLWNEDYYLWVRMITKNKEIINIPETLVYARTGEGMYKRRGGIKYAKMDFLLQLEFYRLGFITLSQMIINTCMRIISRLVPNKLRETIYLKYLRK